MNTISTPPKRNYKKWGVGIAAALGALLFLFQPDILVSLTSLAGLAVVAMLVLLAAWKIVSFLPFLRHDRWWICHLRSCAMDLPVRRTEHKSKKELCQKLI